MERLKARRRGAEAERGKKSQGPAKRMKKLPASPLRIGARPANQFQELPNLVTIDDKVFAVRLDFEPVLILQTPESTSQPEQEKTIDLTAPDSTASKPTRTNITPAARPTKRKRHFKIPEFVPTSDSD